MYMYIIYMYIYMYLYIAVLCSGCSCNSARATWSTCLRRCRIGSLRRSERSQTKSSLRTTERCRRRTFRGTCVMFLQLYYMYVHVHVYSFYMYMYMYVCYTSRGHLLSVLCQWWRIAMFDEQNCREMLHSEFLVTEAHMYVYCIRCTMYNMYMYYILCICIYYF